MKLSIIAISNSEIVASEKNDIISLISSTLHKNGQEILSREVVGASSNVVSASLSNALSKSDFVIMLCENEYEKQYMCKKLICDTFGCSLSPSSFAKYNIDEYSRTQNVPLKREDAGYAQMPEIARVIKNPNSPFQGCLCEKDGKTLFLLPLKHDELHHMFFSSVLPFILKSVGSDSFTFVLKTFGIKSGDMHLLLKDFTKNKLNIGVVFNEYLLSGEVIINIPKSTRKDYADVFVKNLYEKIFPYVYSDKDETLAEYIYSLLSLRHQKIAFAEDFTSGNMTASLFESLDDASSILEESYVCVSKDSKTKILGVERNLADPAEEAYQMASGLLENASCDVVVANCGDIKTGELVFSIGNRDGLHIYKKQMSGNRKQKIIMATNTIFFELIKKLKVGDFALGRTVL